MNAANVKQIDIVFHFFDGLSDSDKVNEMFSYISHYVQAREVVDMKLFGYRTNRPISES